MKINKKRYVFEIKFIWQVTFHYIERELNIHGLIQAFCTMLEQ